MYDPIVVFKGRTETISVDLGIDVSSDIFTSEIRVDDESDSELIATWVITFLTDGTDGKLILTLDELVTSGIVYSNGIMDIKRVTGGKAIPVFDEPLQIVFKGVVTQ